MNGIDNRGTYQETQKVFEIKYDHLETARSKVKEMRCTEFRNGFNFILENLEKLGLAALEELAYPDKENHEEILFDRLTEDLADEILGYHENDSEFSNIHYIVGSDFIRGMTAAAKELLEKSKEVTF